MTIPSPLAVAWRHCGIYVRGVWSHHALPKRSSTHADLWQCCLVQRGELEWLGALGGGSLVAGDLILTSPGYTVRWQPQADVDMLEILFTAIPEPGHQVPWSMLPLPAVIHGVDGTAIQELASGMRAHRWRDDQAAMEARFMCDRFLWRSVGQGFANGDIEHARQRPQWLQDTLVATMSALGDPVFLCTTSSGLLGTVTPMCAERYDRLRGCTPSGLIRRLRVAKAAHILTQDPQTDPGRSRVVADLVPLPGIGASGARKPSGAPLTSYNVCSYSLYLGLAPNGKYACILAAPRFAYFEANSIDWSNGGRNANHRVAASVIGCCV